MIQKLPLLRETHFSCFSISKVLQKFVWNNFRK